jgi:hypothetical protein
LRRFSSHREARPRDRIGIEFRQACDAGGAPDRRAALGAVDRRQQTTVAAGAEVEPARSIERIEAPGFLADREIGDPVAIEVAQVDEGRTESAERVGRRSLTQQAAIVAGEPLRHRAIGSADQQFRHPVAVAVGESRQRLADCLLMGDAIDRPSPLLLTAGRDRKAERESARDDCTQQHLGSRRHRTSSESWLAEYAGPFLPKRAIRSGALRDRCQSARPRRTPKAPRGSPNQPLQRLVTKWDG